MLLPCLCRGWVGKECLIYRRIIVDRQPAQKHLSFCSKGPTADCVSRFASCFYRSFSMVVKGLRLFEVVMCISRYWWSLKAKIMSAWKWRAFCMKMNSRGGGHYFYPWYIWTAFSRVWSCAERILSPVSPWSKCGAIMVFFVHQIQVVCSPSRLYKYNEQCSRVFLTLQ